MVHLRLLPQTWQVELSSIFLRMNSSTWRTVASPDTRTYRRSSGWSGTTTGLGLKCRCHLTYWGHSIDHLLTVQKSGSNIVSKHALATWRYYSVFVWGYYLVVVNAFFGSKERKKEEKKMSMDTCRWILSAASIACNTGEPSTGGSRNDDPTARHHGPSCAAPIHSLR